MLWPASDGASDEDPREIQRRREAYARELDHQIALRRARQHQEQMEREELERKLAPSERSPSKWLVEGGHLDNEERSPSPWRFTQSVELKHEPQQDRGASTGEANGVSSSHPRFRVTDESEASQRLRERAQQMQWKRMLDEQVQEKARLKEKQEAERRRSEEDAAREEMRYLREQQLRAQQRLGQFSPALADSSEQRAETNNAYRSIPSPEVPKRGGFQPSMSMSLRHSTQFNRNTQEDDERSPYYQRERQYGSAAPAEPLMPPPAPSRIPNPQDFYGRLNLPAENRDDIFARGVSDVPRRDTLLQENSVELPRLQQEQQPQQQSYVIEEYRSLLTEIRREREELRRERDEVRREKEELRVQRALLQLENEKMASLVDAQRALNEQHQADLQTQQVQQQFQAVSYQQKLSPIQSVSFNVDNGDDERSNDAPAAPTFSRLHQIQHSLGHLRLDEDQHTIPQGRRRQPPSPMSMADFAAAAPSPQPATNPEPSPRFQRLSRYRPIPAVPVPEESPLNQSLVGESVFVPLSPKSQQQAQGGPAPRSTFSPTSRGDINNRRENPLRNSRVIKSRGFYDFESEATREEKADPQLSELASDSFRDSLGSDLGSSFYDDDEGSDLDDEGDNDDRPPAASGLFQVKVLV